MSEYKHYQYWFIECWTTRHQSNSALENQNRHLPKFSTRWTRNLLIRHVSFTRVLNFITCFNILAYRYEDNLKYLYFFFISNTFNTMMKVRPWQSLRSFPLWSMRGKHDMSRSGEGGDNLKICSIHIFFIHIRFCFVWWYSFNLTSADVLMDIDFWH